MQTANDSSTAQKQGGQVHAQWKCTYSGEFIPEFNLSLCSVKIKNHNNIFK